jgi:hypothetical protein
MAAELTVGEVLERAIQREEEIYQEVNNEVQSMQ